jgi:phage terminase large subunit-like protein
MGKPNPQNLNPCNSENARERQLKSAEKRKENNAKKKLMSQIYAEFLEKEYNVRQGDKERKLTGAELVNECMKKIIARGDSASVSLMREVRETIEGQKINLSGEIKTDMQTTEDRIKAFKNLMGKNE